jgi:hypothetical protein
MLDCPVHSPLTKITELSLVPVHTHTHAHAHARTHTHTANICTQVTEYCYMVCLCYDQTKHSMSCRQRLSTFVTLVLAVMHIDTHAAEYLHLLHCDVIQYETILILSL